MRTFTGKESLSGRLRPTLPFGGDALDIFDFRPEIEVNPGISSAEYSNINVSASLELLNQDVKDTTYLRFLRAGYEPLLLATILYRRLEINQELLNALLRQKDRVCSRHGSGRPVSCNVLAHLEEEWNLVERCGSLDHLFAGVARVDNGERYLTVENNGKSRCEYLGFQAVYHLLRLSGLYLDDVQVEYPVIATDASGQSIQEIRIRTELRLYFQAEAVHNVYTSIGRRLSADPVNRTRLPIEVGIRSPKEILHYLGALTRLQRAAPNRLPLSVATVQGEFMTVFWVRDPMREDEPHGQTAISVVGPDGVRYSIPYPQQESSSRDQSLRVLTLTSELLDVAISGKELPAPSSLILRGN